MREDDLATRLVEYFESTNPSARVRLEEPYDHYGNRGVADVYVRTRDPEPVDRLIELKSDAAVREATGANEILRQYRRMGRYFYRDETHDIEPKLARDGPGVHVELLFAPTPTCVRHVDEYRSLYGSVAQSGTIGDVPCRYTVAFLTGLDRGTDELGYCSVNGPVEFGTAAFRAIVPGESQLAESIDAVTRS